MPTMRAAKLVEPGKMVCQSIDVRPPGPGELLVKTQLAAICGSDLHVVFMDSGIRPADYDFPHGSPGHEGIGEVIESNDPAFQVGERVLTCPAPPHTHCFAEYQTIPGASCVKVPQDLPLADLLMAQQLGTIIFALRQDPMDVVGKNVMVVGQGSAGMFFAYMLKRKGAAKVIVSDLSEARLAGGRHIHGADVAVTAEKDNVLAAVMDNTGAKGVDYLVEAVGRKQTQLEAVDYMAMDGKMLFFGLPDSQQPIPFNFHQYFRRRLRSATTYGTQFEPDLVSFKMAVDLIVRGEIDVSQMVSDTYPIEEIGAALLKAHHDVQSTLKVALSF